MSKKSYVTLHRLELFRPVNIRKGADGLTYDRIDHPNYDQNIFYYFPVVLKADGTVWAHATMYLLSRLESAFPPEDKTLSSIAGDLVDFGSFVDSKIGVDYLVSPKHKSKRPTYAYKAKQLERISKNRTAVSTANRRMGSILGFYKWLEYLNDTKFEFPLYRAKKKYIRFKSASGYDRGKEVEATDLTFPVPKHREDYSGYIDDGEKVRPLSIDEQRVVFQALGNLENIEMNLIFLISLATGARIQTVLTLRLGHFSEKYREGKTIRVKAGFGTRVDTKYGKNYPIYISSWLHKEIVSYINSSRSIKRRKVSKVEFPNTEDQYVFLSKFGSPLYLSKYDGFKDMYRTAPRGGAVRTFIAERLMPVLNDHSEGFDFSFHYLRASFAMNLLNERVKRKGAALDLSDLVFIKERMGHKDIEVTMRYLKHNKNIEIAKFCTEDYDKYLVKLMGVSRLQK